MTYSFLKQLEEALYEIPREGGMRVPGLVVVNRALLDQSDLTRPLEQVKNVAHLPGIVGHSIAMPDVHWGYGFPIGGVAATDAEHGVISPGGVGYDINCGVRVALVPLPFHAISHEQQHALLKQIFRDIPSGMGERGRFSKKLLTDHDYSELIGKGAAWSVEMGFGFQEDLHCTESGGYLAGGDLDVISHTARERGRGQLGSIGSGNHFVEIGEIEALFLEEVAHLWGIVKGWTYVLIHTGSRGFGHQVCQDTLDQFVREGYGKDLPDLQLVAAPIQSAAGKRYLSAMAAAANYAFNNRQRILSAVRAAIERVLHIPPRDVKLLYDVCHNIAKFETHRVKGKERELCVHRKGATRAFGPGAPELPPLFATTGQPVLVPGDMGRASYIMVGEGRPDLFCSACHGAGRLKSRHEAMRIWGKQAVFEAMQERGVLVMAPSPRALAEEMPDAYKDVSLVVQAVQQAHLAKPVAQLRPRLVIKG